MRIIIRSILLIVFAGALICKGVIAEQKTMRIKLKPRAALSGDTFVLSDVAELPEHAPSDVTETVLGNTPWPGHARRVTPALIRMRLASKGVGPNGLEFTGARHCRVSVDTVRIEADEIVSVARECVASRLRHGEGELSVELLHRVESMVVQAGDQQPELRADIHGSGPPIGRVRVEVTAVRSETRLAQVSVSFKVRLTVSVAVARTRLQAGEKLCARMVDFQKRDVSGIQGEWIDSEDMLTGKKAARSIGPGEVVTYEMLEDSKPPVVIEFHERVHLLVQSAGLRVVTLGRALCKARKGEMARAENLSTGREVVGIATGDSTIKVDM